MEVKKINISELKVNNANPRIIKDKQFQLLVNSLLIFPEMLSIRPLVVNSSNEVLGGNQRLRALRHIAQMSDAEIEQSVMGCQDAKKMSVKELTVCMQFWKVFADSKKIEVIDAASLTDLEQKQFIIKDNATFGEWDWDMLANEWDSSELGNWGIDTIISQEDLSNENNSSSSDKIVITIPKQDSEVTKDDLIKILTEVLAPYSNITIK